ncbi:hypothetical protein [Luteimonas aquatica]|uniref:hypothetical protein n=1 Tax=Luteimonas aquatica TaxID=450364 RepID=UPI001F5702C7|nr:hypothetical protein [Luteimonas aquatica]
MILAACDSGAGQAPQAAEPKAAAEAPAQAAPAAPAVAAKLKAGASYADTRDALTAEGWLPLQDWEGCRKGLGARRDLCEQTPELASCGAETQTCVVQFADTASQQVAVLSVAWQEGGSGFGALRSWKFAAAPAAPASGQCPAKDFNGFLKAFAGDEKLRASYTAPVLQVAQMSDQGEAGYVEQKIAVAAKDYNEFFLRYRDGAFRIVNSAGEMGPDPITLDIKPEAGGAYLVGIPDDVEGISYRFEPYRGCWRMTADPVAAP